MRKAAWIVAATLAVAAWACWRRCHSSSLGHINNPARWRDSHDDPIAFGSAASSTRTRKSAGGARAGLPPARCWRRRNQVVVLASVDPGLRCGTAEKGGASREGISCRARPRPYRMGSRRSKGPGLVNVRLAFAFQSGKRKRRRRGCLCGASRNRSCRHFNRSGC